MNEILRLYQWAVHGAVLRCRGKPDSVVITGSCVTSIAGPNGMRNCTGDEGRPFEVGDQVLASSHRKLLSSKAMVVSVAEKPGQDSGRQG
jgi:hypothetical protein